MAVADVALLVAGVGQPAAALIAAASPHSSAFDSVHIGQLTVDYPDLVLAATLGAFLANQHGQRRAAVLVTALSACCFMFTPRGAIWPATVPIALTLVVLQATRVRQLIASSKARRGIARSAKGVRRVTRCEQAASAGPAGEL